MKQSIFLISIFCMAAILVASCVSTSTLKGNGNVVKNEISISDYNEIYIGGSFELVYQQIESKEPFLEISIDENLFPEIEISDKNGRLSIRNKDNVTIQPTRFFVKTNSSRLNKVDTGGSAKITLKDTLRTNEMKINISGSGNLVVDNLFCEQFNVQISGSGSVKLNGKTNDAEYSISGSGNINASNFETQNTTCKVSGSGDVFVNVNNNLNVSISGSGSLTYTGEPKTLETKISGSGKVIKK